MKRFLMAAGALAFATAAQAADLPAKPVYKSPAMVPVAYNWTGFYVGGHVGWGWQNATASLVSVPPGSPLPAGTLISSDSNGFLGGGQVGWNWQTGQLVFGLEGDFSWTGQSTATTVTSTVPVAGTTVTGATKYNWFATGTARVGVASSNWLAYVKGGVAFADLDFTGSDVVPGVGTFTVNPFSDTRTGWTVGAGFEYGFAPNWSAKIEYNYMDFGTEQYPTATTPFVGNTVIDHDLQVHAVKGGINFRWSPF
jgi:outer membrane immunogenic protein